MFLTYGGVGLADLGCARFTWSRQGIKNRAGIITGFKYQISCGELSFRCVNHADAQSKMNIIDAALAVQGGDLIFQNPDASPSASSFLSAATLSGIRCTEHTWSDKPGGQYQTWRSYSANFEWETALSGVSGGLLSDFSERMEVSGGGLRYTMMEAVNNVAPAAFPTVLQTAYRARQSGRIVGYATAPVVSVASGKLYAALAPPLFGLTNPPLMDTVVTRTNSERVGVSGFKNSGLDYSYEFLSATLLVPVVTEWTM
jgi:hypothetical protein